MNEVWKPVTVKGGHYSSLYQVSSLGRVKSSPRNGTLGGVLKTDKNSDGHLEVGLYRNNKRVGFFVHTLVLEAFVGPRPENLEACHNDGDPSNNRPENLRWDTKSSNALDRQKHGTDWQRNKTHCKRGHRLEVPNLVLNQLKKGYRSCLACQRASSYISNVNPGLKGDYQSLSDNYYKSILTEGEVQCLEKTYSVT